MKNANSSFKYCDIFFYIFFFYLEVFDLLTKKNPRF